MYIRHGENGLEYLVAHSTFVTVVNNRKTVSSQQSADSNSSTLCLKKVPIFKLSVTLSNLNGFSKFLHCWKAHEICFKNLYDTSHIALGMLLHYIGKLKIQIFCKCGRKQKQIAF